MDGSEIISCDHIQKKSNEKRRLIIKCVECDNDFQFKDCISGLILALKDFYRIESIVISDYMEKRLDKNQVDILIQIRDIVDDIESFSSRVPQGDGCSECDLKPSLFYPQLKKEFISNPKVIYEVLTRLKEKMEKKNGCIECERDLKQELKILGGKALELKSDVFAEGFGIKG